MNLESTKFVYNYDLLLDELKTNSDTGIHNSVSALQKILYSKYSEDADLVLDKTLDTYI